MQRVLLLGVVVGELLATGVAHADDASLGAAREVYAQGNLSRALELFEACLTSGGNEPDAAGDVYYYLGVLRAVAGDAREAQVAFEVALALRPDLSPPGELGPPHREAFARAREARAGAVLEARVILAPDAGSDSAPRIAVEWVGAPSGTSLGAQVSAPYADATLWSETLAVPGPSMIELPTELVAHRTEIALTVEARDEHGNVLLRAVSVVPLPAEATVPLAAPRPSPVQALVATPPASAPEPDRGLFASPWLWTAVGVVVAGAATAAIVVTQSEDRFTFGAPTFRTGAP